MPSTELFAGVPVRDIPAAREWYALFFGRAADFIPNDNEAVWQLGEHAWIYVVGDAARAGHGLLTLLVDDVDQQLAELKERGIETGTIDTIPGAVRKLEVTDPDGNRITFGQPLS